MLRIFLLKKQKTLFQQNISFLTLSYFQYFTPIVRCETTWESKL